MLLSLYFISRALVYRRLFHGTWYSLLLLWTWHFLGTFILWWETCCSFWLGLQIIFRLSKVLQARIFFATLLLGFVGLSGWFWEPFLSDGTLIYYLQSLFCIGSRREITSDLWQYFFLKFIFWYEVVLLYWQFVDLLAYCSKILDWYLRYEVVSVICETFVVIGSF